MHYVYSTYYKELREVLLVFHKVCKNSDRVVKLQQLCLSAVYVGTECFLKFSCLLHLHKSNCTAQCG